MKISSLSDVIGAEVTGLDLSRPLSKSELDDVYQAFLDNLVLVFRGQNLTPLEQVAFSEYFGSLEWQENSKQTHPDHEKVLVLSNEIRPDGTAVGVVDAGDFWHTDSSHHEEPVKITILHSIRNPSQGGDTEFCNMYSVYDALPDAMKRRIENLHGIHHISRLKNPRVTISPSRPEAQDFYESQTNRPGVLQPIVRTHDETGRQALYVNPRFTVGIQELNDSDGQLLLDQLFAYITDKKRPYHFRHKWKNGDLVMWDNRCLNHRAVGGYGMTDIRRMHRTTVIGQRAFYRPSART